MEKAILTSFSCFKLVPHSFDCYSIVVKQKTAVLNVKQFCSHNNSSKYSKSKFKVRETKIHMQIIKMLVTKTTYEPRIKGLYF